MGETTGFSDGGKPTHLPRNQGGTIVLTQGIFQDEGQKEGNSPPVGERAAVVAAQNTQAPMPITQELVESDSSMDDP